MSKRVVGPHTVITDIRHAYANEMDEMKKGEQHGAQINDEGRNNKSGMGCGR